MSELEAFRHQVETFIRLTNMSPTAFGRKALGDPDFVRGLRKGREPRTRVRTQVLDFIDNAVKERSNGKA